MNKKMVQYVLWHNCNGQCKFCLIKNKQFLLKKDQLKSIELVSKNIDYVDWLNEFDRGISILGGEIYYITDKELQEAYLNLIDKIIDKILLPNHNNGNKYCKYSTVTNGYYDPKFLFKCIDKIIKKVGLTAIDINFSYDIKYRYMSEDHHKIVLDNIKAFQKRYPKYTLGVQTICTEYLINEIINNNFLQKWYEDNPKTIISLLYTHKYHTNYILDDFFPKRESLFKLLQYLQNNGYDNILCNFHNSVRNSAIFKYTGIREKPGIIEESDYTQKPSLSIEKREINPKCGHSTLYQCYSDCDSCILCDMDRLLGK